VSALQDQQLPEFAVAMRGYDRLQVDEYIERLNRWLDEAQTRMGVAEARAADLESEVMNLRQRVAAMGDTRLQSGDQPLDAVATRLGQMLDDALADCNAIRERARNEAEAVVAAARQTAGEIIARTQHLVAEAKRRAEAVEEEEAALRQSSERELAELEQRRSAVVAEMVRLRGALDGLVSGDRPDPGSSAGPPKPATSRPPEEPAGTG